MKHGDFTLLAKEYVHRAGYSLTLLRAILSYISSLQPVIQTIDIGAGTGKLTENLIELGLTGIAIEPNDAMREEGEARVGSSAFTWKKGTAELTGLEDSSADWILMGSSFHWTDPQFSLKEFQRVLKPGGFFTALWNPRDLEKSPFHLHLEEKISHLIPNLQRVSSGSGKNMQGMDATLLSTGHFEDLLFMEAPHILKVNQERYLGAWRSVNDIRVQAGEEGFAKILDLIQREIEPYSSIEVPYKTRAWTVRSTK